MNQSVMSADKPIKSKSSNQKLPLKFRILLTLHSFISNTCRRSNFTVNRFLLNLFDPKIPASLKPRHGIFTFDTIMDSSRNLWSRFFVPSSTDNDNNPVAVIVYFHGGGFVFFSPNSTPYDDLCRRLARDLHAVVVSVNYGLSPEHKFPSQYDDGFDALKFLDRMDYQMIECELDLSRCFIAGDSAGGNIAHHVAVRAGEYEFKRVKIKGLISIQPFFGGEERTESEMRLSKSPMLNLEQTDWYWKAFLPDGSDRNHAAARVFGDAEDISLVRKFPATLLIIGGRDQLRDWGKKYYDWLKKEGKEVELVEYENAIHGFYAVPELKDGSLMIKDVKEFIHKQSGL